MTAVRSQRLGWHWRLAFSVLLAYPISGVLFALAKIVWVFPLTHPTWRDITFDLILLAATTLTVPLFAGFLPKLFDDGSDEWYLNLYPIIVPTAAILFFVWSRGWRWFGHQRA